MSILKNLFGKNNNAGSIQKKEFSERKPLLPNEQFQGFQMHKRYGERIVNKIVEIDAKGFVGTFRECHFVNCEIKIRCSARYTFVMTDKCTFDDCLIWSHTKQIGGNWNPVFRNCSFKGRYELQFENKLINCDFSQAKISIVGLLGNNNIDGINGVTYPTVAIIDPRKNLSQWQKIKKPDDYEDLIWTSKRDSGLVIMNLQEFTADPMGLWKNIKSLHFVKTAYNNVYN